MATTREFVDAVLESNSFDGFTIGCQGRQINAIHSSLCVEKHIFGERQLLTFHSSLMSRLFSLTH